MKRVLLFFVKLIVVLFCCTIPPAMIGIVTPFFVNANTWYGIILLPFVYVVAIVVMVLAFYWAMMPARPIIPVVKPVSPTKE